jgi:hypothetical protein
MSLMPRAASETALDQSPVGAEASMSSVSTLPTADVSNVTPWNVSTLADALAENASVAAAASRVRENFMKPPGWG